MYRRWILLLVAVFSSSGCVSLMALEGSKSTTSLNIQRVHSHTSNAEQITSVCVVGNIQDNGNRKGNPQTGTQFSIPVSTEDWPTRCSTAVGFWTNECGGSAPTITISRDLLGPVCAPATVNDSYQVALDSTTQSLVLINDGRRKKTILMLDAAANKRRGSPWSLLFLPITIPVDLVTAPLQLFFYYAFTSMYADG